MLTVPIRFLLILLGWFIVPMAILTEKEGKFRKPFYIFDNEEDGYNGDKLGWYSNYLKRPVNKWDAYMWSAWRNPCFNLRYVKWFSIPALPEGEVTFEGNTYHKGYEYSFDKVRKKVWFDFSLEVDGKKRTTKFLILPITRKYSLYLLYGWKFYPNLYLDPYWTKRVEKEGWPKYKDRAVFVFNIRVKKA